MPTSYVSLGKYCVPPESLLLCCEMRTIIFTSNCCKNWCGRVYAYDRMHILNGSFLSLFFPLSNKFNYCQVTRRSFFGAWGAERGGRALSQGSWKYDQDQPPVFAFRSVWTWKDAQSLSIVWLPEFLLRQVICFWSNFSYNILRLFLTDRNFLLWRKSDFWRNSGKAQCGSSLFLEPRWKQEVDLAHQQVAFVGPMCTFVPKRNPSIL